MRHFQLSLIVLLILILAVVPLVGCVSASKYDTLQIENTALKTGLEVTKSDLSYAKTNSETLRNDYNTVKAQYDRLQATYNSLKRDSDTQKAAYDSLNANYNSLKRDSDTQKATYDSLKTNYDSLKRDSATQKATYDSLNTNYNSLKTNYDSLSTLYNNLVRLVSSTPPTPTYTTWIDKYQATYGQLPVAPDWLVPLIPLGGLDADGRITRKITLNTLTPPSAQYWARRSPSEKNMILELVSWLGGNPVDYEWKIKQMSPP